jgi:hypothetical protein
VIIHFNNFKSSAESIKSVFSSLDRKKKTATPSSNLSSADSIKVASLDRRRTTATQLSTDSIKSGFGSLNLMDLKYKTAMLNSADRIAPIKRGGKDINQAEINQNVSIMVKSSSRASLGGASSDCGSALSSHSAISGGHVGYAGILLQTFLYIQGKSRLSASLLFQSLWRHHFV